METMINDQTLRKVAEIVGNEEAVEIVAVLEGVDETTDDEIANKTGIRLNSVRKILYKLYDHSLVALRRSRDQHTGWFIFHWRLQPDQLEGFILNQKKRVLEKLEARLGYEKDNDFYYCGTQECKKVPFEEAMELIFRCPTCNRPLMHFDNSILIETLRLKVDELRKELSE
jgi:transcription initiation factor TFIIE subunit alpha